MQIVPWNHHHLFTLPDRSLLWLLQYRALHHYRRQGQTHCRLLMEKKGRLSLIFENRAIVSVSVTPLDRLTAKRRFQGCFGDFYGVSQEWFDMEWMGGNCALSIQTRSLWRRWRAWGETMCRLARQSCSNDSINSHSRFLQRLCSACSERLFLARFNPKRLETNSYILFFFFLSLFFAFIYNNSRCDALLISVSL